MHLKKIVRGIYSKRSPYRMKVAINKCFGGFSISSKAFGSILKRKGIPYESCKNSYSIGNVLVDDYCMEFYKAGHLGEEDHRIYSWYQFDKKYEEFGNHETERISRTDPDLIAVIEELKDGANGIFAKLRILEIPDDVKWHIEDYDGSEHIAENHRTWY